MSEPSAVEVIAEAEAQHEMGVWVEVLPDRFRRRCTCGEFLMDARDNEASLREHRAAAALAALKAAGFVVATRDEIRAMSPSEQAGDGR